jgi:hypothetical protein
MSTDWRDQMKDDLEAMTDDVAFVVCGEWITELTQEILPWLGEYRRHLVTQMIDTPDSPFYHDLTKLAEATGTRAGAIRRLVNEGRALNRERGDGSRAA